MDLPSIEVYGPRQLRRLPPPLEAMQLVHLPRYQPRRQNTHLLLRGCSSCNWIALPSQYMYPICQPAVTWLRRGSVGRGAVSMR